MRHSLSIFIGFLLIATQVHSMDEQTFVDRLKNTHPFFTQQNLTAQIKQIDKQATTAIEDWTLGLDSQYKDENATDVSTSTYDKLETTSIDLSVKKKFAQSGADVVLKHTWKEKNKDVNNVRNKFSIDYTLPLLQNKDGINDQLQYDLADINIHINTLEQAEKEEDFIADKLKKLIDLAYYQEQYNINQQRLSLAKSQLDLVNKKFAASLVDKVDVLSQEDAYQGAKQQLLRAKQDLLLMRQEIAILLSMEGSSIKADLNLYQPYQFNANNLKDLLAKDSRVLKKNDLQQDLLERELKSFKNQSQAQLDLNLGLSSEGEKSTYSQSLENQSPTWNIGLDLSYPIGGVKNKTDVEKTQVKLSRKKQEKQEKLISLYTNTATLKEKIELLWDILNSNKIRIDIAKSRAQEEVERYNKGNTESNFVISAQNNAQDAHLNYAKAARDYQKAVIDFKAATDQLWQ